ncbi:hypothetical protein CK203_013041 [Vitis vinifera]|uniref:Uncharacterized protein n=1 Tax=Vitis vinifera TaxID=29760 RepID=A0A438JLQ2_VITVI|nr:hypothetical protein CK203_013041 [Vitis vinifera]
MASTSTQSSSSSSSIRSGQSSTMTSIPSYQMLNHTLADFIDGTSICPEKDLSLGVTNPAFDAWRRQD